MIMSMKMSGFWLVVVINIIDSVNSMKVVNMVFLCLKLFEI